MCLHPDSKPSCHHGTQGSIIVEQGQGPFRDSSAHVLVVSFSVSATSISDRSITGDLFSMQ